jgi:hypothetical protein
MALKDRKITGGALTPVVIAGQDETGEIGAVSVSESWRVELQYDEDANSSAKTFTVPSDEEWQILLIWVELNTTATVGNRQLEVFVLNNEPDNIGELARAGIVQAASLYRFYLFAPGAADLTSFRDTSYLTVPLPMGTFLQPNDQIRIWDNKAIDASADDMIVQMKIAKRKV